MPHKIWRLHTWLRVVASAFPAAGIIVLASCAHQGATPSAEPSAATSPAPAAVPAKLGASVFVVHLVSDIDAFERFFADGDAERDAAGVRGYLLSRLGDGRVVVHLFAENLDDVQAALNSERMQAYLNRSGAPDASFVWVTRDVSLSLPAKHPPEKTFSLYFKLEVADFDRFKRSFEEREALYGAHGVIGRGLHQSTTGRFVVVHFVGTTRAELEALTKRPEFAELLSLAAPEGAGKPLIAEDLARSRPH